VYMKTIRDSILEEARRQHDDEDIGWIIATILLAIFCFVLMTIVAFF